MARSRPLQGGHLLRSLPTPCRSARGRAVQPAKRCRLTATLPSLRPPAGMLPGIERQPRKKLEPSPERLLGLLHRWQDEAVRAGRTITRIAVAFEAGRDGFWLARWLAARGVEAHVIHASSVAVSREHRRAKTDRLDTELLKRGFLGWLRGERGHCSMARVPTIAEEDAKRPNRERDCLMGERTRIVNRKIGRASCR